MENCTDNDRNLAVRRAFSCPPRIPPANCTERPYNGII